MAIKFKFDGIEFEVSTPREAALVLREIRRTTRPTPSLLEKIGKAVKAQEQAVEERQAELLRNLAQANKRIVGRGNAAADVAYPAHITPGADDHHDRLDMTHSFLIAMRRTPRMNAEQVGKVLNINHPKGLGPRSMLINNVLREHGLEPDDVYTNTERTAEGRVWKAGEKLEDAITAVEAARKLKEFVFS